MVGGRKEWLSAALFETLAELMLAKVATLTGVTKADPLVVHRLRQMIDSAGDDSLVEACGGEFGSGLDAWPVVVASHRF